MALSPIILILFSLSFLSLIFNFQSFFLSIFLFIFSLYYLSFLFYLPFPLKSNPKSFSHPIKISTVVPAYNAEKTIEKCINSVKGCDEIIVVFEGSDKTVENIKRFKVKVLSRKTRLGKAKALNLGIKKAKNEYVLIIDADTFTSSIPKLKKLKLEEKAAITGRIKVIPRSLFDHLQAIEFSLVNLIRFLQNKRGYIDSMPGNFGLYRKSVLRKLGYFNADTLTEDYELSLRMKKAGYKIGYLDEIEAVTELPSSFSQFLKQRIRWYRGEIEVFKKFKCIIPFSFYLLPPLLLLLNLIYTFPSIPFLDFSLVFILIILILGSLIYSKAPFKQILLVTSILPLVCYGLLIYIIWIIAFLKELFKTKKSW